jgi:hypothetical protein
MLQRQQQQQHTARQQPTSRLVIKQLLSQAMVAWQQKQYVTSNVPAVLPAWPVSLSWCSCQVIDVLPHPPELELTDSLPCERVLPTNERCTASQSS